MQMAWKTILVHVDDTQGCGSRMQLAARIAREHAAELIGVFRVPEIDPRLFSDPTVAMHNIDQITQRNRDTQASARSAFEAAAEQAKVTGTWQTVEHHLEASLAGDALYADLVVAGQALPDERHPSVESIVMSSGRPTLLVPRIGTRSTDLSRIMIAWTPTREASRAVHDALPMLAHAEEVQVVCIGHTDAQLERARTASEMLSTHLARHGINAQPHVEMDAELQIADVLLSRAADQDIHALVMGAYGHSKFREMVFGGATRALLHNMTIPVLMSH
ncbi:MAG: nucleotide-binding universal stress UspA family protein [Gammaproteobacteria bacterium]|jgi:nucleotide-binding universal stress UspA family protein